MKEKIISFFKNNGLFALGLFLIIFLFNFNLPYYVDMPGGIININDRINCNNCNDINGSLNMLYVSEYEATIPTFLLSFIIPNWDLEDISEQQINNEDTNDIYNRGKIMLDNSINNAIYVAYKAANKKIEVKDKKTVVIATTFDNGLEIGDEILEVNDEEVSEVSEIKEIINNKNNGEELKIKILRNGKEEYVKSKIKETDGSKVIGVVIVTNFDYKTDPEIDLSFKDSESGSSGGLMMALSIYTKISDIDIVRNRNIAGTGTIDIDGKVGEIDGIKYKIIGAVKNKMDIVLVPSDNYEEALKVKKDNNYDIEIISVDNFNDAIEYLQK